MTEIILDVEGKATIQCCARCGGYHVGIVLRPFTRRHSNMSHFAMCPTCDEPILFCFLDGSTPLQGTEAGSN